MQLLKQSESTAARRRILVYLVDDTDGKTAETGVTVSAGDIKISKNGAAEANHAGTWTEVASGLYHYEFTSGELDTFGYVSFRIVKSGVRTFVKELQVVSFDPYDLGTHIADATLTRDMSSVTGESARSLLNAIRFLRNKWTITGATLSVKKEDDSTEAWNAALSTDAAAIPITGNDPA
jgi:hypothetical protein